MRKDVGKKKKENYRGWFNFNSINVVIVNFEN